MSRAALAIEQLSINLASPGGSKVMVRDVNLELPPGQALTLVGETGCGKSLVAQAVIGLLPEEMTTTGKIFYHGSELQDLTPTELKRLWGRNIFLFPQEPIFALNPTMRALGQTAEVFRWVVKRNGKKPIEAARRMLEKTGLNPQTDGRKYPCQLSGGMNQRLAAAITLAQPADLIIADEPTKGLDQRRRDQVVDLLKGLLDQGKSLLIISHDLEVVRRLGGWTAVMYGGRVMEQGSAEVILDAPGHPYPKALIRALPGNGLKPIAMKLNDRPLNGGCVFADRCVEADDLCFEVEPDGGGPDGRRRCHAG